MIGFDLHSQAITEAETGKPVRDYSNGAGRDDGGWDQGAVVGVRMCRLWMQLRSVLEGIGTGS